ncbi:MAG: response regulator [Cyclobacteriaceae bacterium]
MIKLALVDDHKMFREGLNFALSQIPGFEVLFEASDGQEFLDKLHDAKPDVVIMDISMPKVNGIEATEKALEIDPKIKIMALSMFSDTEYYQKMVAAGVKGFLMKEAGIEELTKAIEEIYSGGTFFSQELLQRIITEMANPNIRTSKDKIVDLTRREEEVLELICKGFTNKEIADQLFISQKTVEGHKSNLLEKTNTKNSINLMLFCLKNHLINLEFLPTGGKPS